MTSRGAYPFLAFLLALALSGPARAEDENAPVEPAAPPPAEPAVPVADPASETTSAVPATTPSKTRKGRRTTREKEAEGSQAPNRFEADTVVKSKYRLDGQPLEVDPD